MNTPPKLPPSPVPCLSCKFSGIRRNSFTPDGGGETQESCERICGFKAPSSDTPYRVLPETPERPEWCPLTTPETIKELEVYYPNSWFILRVIEEMSSQLRRLEGIVRWKSDKPESK